jgi:hypothetical protein
LTFPLSFSLPPFCFFFSFYFSVQYSSFIFLVFFSVTLKTMSVLFCEGYHSVVLKVTLCITLSGSTNHLFNTLQRISFSGPESDLCLTLSGSTNHLFNTLQRISLSGSES